MDVQVISVSHEGAGSSSYYVIPEERSDEVYYVSDLKNFDGPIKKFITITGYTGWMQENPDVNVTSFWETVVV